jgi:Rad52/22 family double-strand break repair protein
MSDIASQVKAVNSRLKGGEPGNISVDSFSDYTGYKPQYIVDALNEAFGIGLWGFEEIESEIITTPTEKGVSMLAVAKVKVWLAGVDFQPAAWGQSRVTKGDIGDAKKGAQTDGLKKALSYFSIGNRAYYGLLEKNSVKR